MGETFLTRRTFVAGSAALAALAATGCGGGDGGGKDRVLGSAFANGLSSPAYLIAGAAQRAPLVLFEDGRPLRDNAPKQIDVELFFGGNRVAQAQLARHDADIPTPYYPLNVKVADPGVYEVRAKFSDVPVQFRASPRDAVKLAQVGDPLRAVATPTTANAQGVNPICTRTPEPCPFHAVSLEEAMASKSPIAFLISTPGYCQTAVCGPVLEMLMAEAKNYPNIKMVHAEVYIDPQEFASGKPNPRPTEAVQKYSLSFEPSLYVANAGGVITSRLDFTWDRTELKAALTSAANG